MEHIGNPPGIAENTMNEYRQLVRNFRRAPSDQRIPGRWDWQRRILLNELLEYAQEREAYTDHQSLNMILSDNHIFSPDDRTREIISSLTRTQIRLVLVNPDELSVWRTIMDLYAQDEQIHAIDVGDVKSMQRVSVDDTAVLIAANEHFSSALSAPDPDREVSSTLNFHDVHHVKEHRMIFERWWELSLEA